MVCYAIAVLDLLPVLRTSLLDRKINDLPDEAWTHIIYAQKFSSAYGIHLGSPPAGLQTQLEEFACFTLSSSFAIHVSNALLDIGFDHERNLFSLESVPGVSIEIACPDQMVVIECDGPNHYLLNVGDGQRREDGPTKAKRLLLQHLGWNVINLHAAEAYNLNSAHEVSEEWLRDKLSQGCVNWLSAGFSPGGTCTATAQNLAKIEGIIALAVTETNKAYELSGITTSFRLVKTHYEDSYNDYANTWESTLGYLRNNGDGWLDYVHAMRDQYGADFVSMLVDTSEYYGIGYMPSSPSAADAFTLVHRDCATGYYSFGHEIGQNMGCNHDALNAGGYSGGYNYGYQDPSARFRSILAYQCSSQSCPRIQYFSSPNLSYLGSPLGTASANNALVIRENLAAYANFRQSINPPPLTSAPTAAPTAVPTTAAPTAVPTTAAPTSARPTAAPTAVPTTAAPTTMPTTAAPTSARPTAAPTAMPTTASPTVQPTTAAPTAVPTALPTKAPTAAPTTANDRSLTTTFAGGYVGAAGHMFDIKAAKKLNVTNFAVHASSASLAMVEVYMKITTGAFSGSQSSPAKWRKIGTATFRTNAAGSPSILPEGTFAPVTVKAGVTQAFYITFTQATNINRYSVGLRLGKVQVFNSDLTIYHGYAKYYPFGSDVTLRAWNGILSLPNYLAI
ncbi:Metallo-peptidase family M12B Reprolysin-like [Fragilaria crotonensis]|nr:Metallo-peptidase family M12B Reprolysin-like [Fragilaria crotonensis]